AEHAARGAGVRIAATEAFVARLDGRATVGKSLVVLPLSGEAPLDAFEIVDFKTPDAILIVQSTFERVAPRADQFAELFYERFFELAPSVQDLFEETDMVTQRQMLMSVLA